MSGLATFIPPALTPLTAGHDVAQFDSGERELDAWLIHHALTQARRRLSATHVWSNSDRRVLGYVTLAAGAILREDLTNAIGHGLPRIIPSILLARLALHRDLHRQGLGGVLLTEALGIAARAAEDVAAAFVVVDALHESAAEFYIHYGFRPLPEPRRLVLKVATIPFPKGSAVTETQPEAQGPG